MKPELLQLATVSAALGAHTHLVQAAGGNTSVKIDQTMWIKASGKWLAYAEREDIFVPVKLKLFQKAFEEGVEFPAQAALLGESTLRPSIETALHAILPHKYVLHVHPVAVLAHAVQKNAYEIFSKRFANLSWAMIPYVRPGWQLAQEVGKALQANPETNVFVFANHGLLVAGDDLQATADLLQHAVSLAETTPRRVSCVVQRAPRGFCVPQDSRIQALAFDPVSYQHCQAGVLYPDQTVFLGPNINCSSAAQDLEAWSYVVEKNQGVFIVEQAPASLEAMLLCHAEVLARTPEQANLASLDDAEVQSLLNWDAEKYRQSGNA